MGGIGLATQHLRPTARDMGVNDIVLYLFALLLRCDAMCLWLKVDLPDSATPPESAKADTTCPAFNPFSKDREDGNLSTSPDSIGSRSKATTDSGESP